VGPLVLRFAMGSSDAVLVLVGCPSREVVGRMGDGSGHVARNVVPVPWHTVRNLTPHPVRLVGPDGVVALPPDGPPARLVLAEDLPDGSVEIRGTVIPLVRTAATSAVTGLPDPVTGVLLIVARAVAEEFPDRDDLAYPHRATRDAKGAVTGCRALGRPASRRDTECAGQREP